MLQGEMVKESECSWQVNHLNNSTFLIDRFAFSVFIAARARRTVFFKSYLQSTRLGN
jgi:hypothetical protein